MIVVTGGAGFIGSCLVKYLNEQGRFDIFIVDSLADKDKWKNLLELGFRDFIHKDDFLKNFHKLPKFEIVYHLGANSSTTAVDGDLLLRNNYYYTQSLCRFCVESDVKFVYASSAATYGNGERGYDDLETGLVQLRPLNLYGFSKHMFDLFAQRSDLFSSERIIGLKYFNVFGPGEDHKGEMSSVVLKSYKSLIRDGSLQLFKSYRLDVADGEQKRDFVYVKDAVRQTVYLANHPKKLGGIFNIGSGKAHSFNELVAAVGNALGKEIQPRYVDMPEDIKQNYQYFTEANMTKFNKTASASYDLPAVTPFRAAVRDYVCSYLMGKKFTMKYI